MIKHEIYVWYNWLVKLLLKHDALILWFGWCSTDEFNEVKLSIYQFYSSVVSSSRNREMKLVSTADAFFV